ncbi:MAG TPA: BadF/BadG/BcrA/BcrD ATPase family protein, partial [Pyrinomonadaceae bacterium]|nr:BadF/BadG/BcrA/BcrD ATPase family protein [Pyrinomonadaceae bacterium]
AEVGLAGVRRGDLRQRMREALTGLGIHHLEVVTDADIALFGATAGEQGLVVIAGTGSICCGMNGRGKKACAGGWGPIAGDEGSGSWIARRALQAVARASDGRGNETELSEAACDYFKASSDDDLAIAIYAPHMTNDRIAGFARFVIEAAEKGDRVARAIVIEAGRELGLAACAVIEKLQMERERFQVAYVGGVFTSGDTILAHMRRQIKTLAPRAFTAPPKLAPAEAAARMAATHLPRLALAG